VVVPLNIDYSDTFVVDDTSDVHAEQEDTHILQALNAALPSTPRLLHPDNPDFTSAMTEAEQLVTARFYYIFGGRNASLTEEDVTNRRTAFLDVLDTLYYRTDIPPQERAHRRKYSLHPRPRTMALPTIHHSLH